MCVRECIYFYSHCKNESLISRPATVVARGEFVNPFRDRFHKVDRNDGIEGESKLIPLSAEVRLLKRPDSNVLIDDKLDEADEIGELLWFRTEKKPHTE